MELAVQQREYNPHLDRRGDHAKDERPAKPSYALVVYRTTVAGAAPLSPRVDLRLTVLVLQ